MIDWTPDRNDSAPLRRQLANHLKERMEDGTYPPDTALPSVRRLAARWGLNPGTVAGAFRILSDEGWIVSRPGSGAWVRRREARVIIPAIAEIPDEMVTIEDVEWLGRDEMPTAPGPINLASTSPDISFISMPDLRGALIRTLDEDGIGVFGYHSGSGYRELRSLLAGFHAGDALPPDASDIQIISGAQQGLDILAKALLSGGDTVVVEAPTYTGALAVFRSRGARIEGVPMLSDGMDLDRLASVMRRFRPRLIYTVPAYQNPTGFVWSEAKKRALLETAAAFGCLIVEDDYLREMTYRGPLPATLRSMDRSGSVLFVKSYSKLLAPGIRVGYMAVPPRLRDVIAHAKHATDIFTSGLLQRMFMHLVREGLWESHLERMLDIFRGRWETMAEAVEAELVPLGARFSPASGGLSVWIELPGNVNLQSLYRRAQTSGVLFVPGTVFETPNAPIWRYLRLGFGQADEPSIRQGVARIGEAMRTVGRG